MLNAVILSVIVVISMSVIIWNVVMLRVMAPFSRLFRVRVKQCIHSP
jgi:hypothetical protein